MTIFPFVMQSSSLQSPVVVGSAWVTSPLSIKFGSSFLILAGWNPSLDEDHDGEIHQDDGEGWKDEDQTNEEANENICDTGIR